MAGIEKICEFSGDYPGSNMYQYKKNSIQIVPKYRKKFKKSEHILHIFQPDKKWRGKCNSWSMDYDVREMDDWTPAFKNVKEWETFFSSRNGCRVSFEYMYVLQVFKEDLQGEVNGLYLNWSYDLTAVKRKIKRIIGGKKLNIKVHDMTYQEWRDINDKTIEIEG
jgi:hypothetical protein